MKFSLKALLGFTLVAAIAFAVVRSTLWRLTAKHDIDNVGFLESNEAMWRLAEQHARDAESSVAREP